MKPDSDSVKKLDSDNEGIDFLVALQVGGGILCFIFLIWLILRSVLHII